MSFGESRFILGREYFPSMDVLKHVSYTLTKNKLSLLIRIDNFPSFVTSKASYNTRNIIVNNTRWCILVDLTKYCQKSKKYILINAETSDQPESLAAVIKGKREKESIDCSFDVEAKIKFKQPHPMDDEKMSTRKFCFNSSNGYADGLGSGDLAKINVVFTFFFYNFKCTLFLTYCVEKNKMG